MVEIKIVYEGSLRTTAEHGPSLRNLQTDAPVDNQGKGESFSPTDLAATALGACMMTIMGILADKDDIPLQGTRVRVTKHMVADPLRRIGKIEVDLALPAGISDKDQRRLEQAARSCPVQQSLHPDIEVPIHFGWGEL